jgi:L-ribulose-5-phosphate 3-epimerase
MVAPAPASPIRIAAITDEFSPDLDIALDAMSAAGVTGVELRTIHGTNIVELSDREITHAVDAARQRGMPIVGLASPLLKCVLPGAPPIDSRFQQDVFGSPFTIDDQPRLTRRVFELAKLTGARIVRVFSYWRTVDPQRCEDQVIDALRALADDAATRGITIGLENEFACNVGTAREAARLLQRLPRANLQLIWDPANAFVLGETPFPDGYRVVPHERLLHVHVKDCVLEHGRPVWGPPGTSIDWAGQIDALMRDSYSGWLSLETHWTGPSGNKLEASEICARLVRDFVAAAGA